MTEPTQLADFVGPDDNYYLPRETSVEPVQRRLSTHEFDAYTLFCAENIACL